MWRGQGKTVWDTEPKKGHALSYNRREEEKIPDLQVER